MGEAHDQQRVDRNSRQAVCIPGWWLPQVCCSRGRRSSCCSPSSDSEGSPPPWHPPSRTGWRGTSAGSRRSAIADLEELKRVEVNLVLMAMFLLCSENTQDFLVKRCVLAEKGAFGVKPSDSFVAGAAFSVCGEKSPIEISPRGGLGPSTVTFIALE